MLIQIKKKPQIIKHEDGNIHSVHMNESIHIEVTKAEMAWLKDNDPERYELLMAEIKG